MGLLNAIKRASISGARLGGRTALRGAVASRRFAEGRIRANYAERKIRNKLREERRIPSIKQRAAYRRRHAPWRMIKNNAPRRRRRYQRYRR